MLNAIIQPTSSENKIYKRYRKNYNMVVSINLTPSWAFCIISTISFLSFNRFCFLHVAISNFSFKHSRQRFICELYGTHFLPISHLTFGWWLEFFIRPISFDNCVSFLYSFRLNDFLWFESYFLKVVSHEPK